jgi:glycosyltransferase involved in cell wall biosynthesis
MSHPHPLVSILIPTRDRPLYFRQLIKNILAQTYPLQQLEVVVSDDGTNSIEQHLPYSKLQIVYLRETQPITLAEKRQRLKDTATGEIMVCMDDDDYYPPTRVEHAVKTLQSNPGIDFAHAPVFLLYNPQMRRLYQTGPWLKNWGHATFAFRKKFAQSHHYHTNDRIGEERLFTNFYRVPYVTLQPEMTIVALIHKNNSVPKNDLDKTIQLPYPMEHIIRNPQARHFYQQLQITSGGPVQL